ncbi:unnamed protein product [Symbiodinium sp. CCMP2456]|nr:unnamed protein product [Symbiodinium sp. CCMP2456]
MPRVDADSIAGEFCMTDLQMVFLKMDEECGFHLSHACRSHPKFEQYRALMKDHGEEVFTYIDKVVADNEAFMKWLDETEKMEAASRTASQQMLGHPLFQSFCSEVGVAAEQWGQEGADLTTEVTLFQEWVAAKELVDAGVVPPPPAAVSMDTMETQVLVLNVIPTECGSMPPPPPPTEVYCTGEDVPRPADDVPQVSPGVRKRLAPEFESASSGGNNVPVCAEMVQILHTQKRSSEAVCPLYKEESLSERPRQTERCMHDNRLTFQDA